MDAYNSFSSKNEIDNDVETDNHASHKQSQATTITIEDSLDQDTDSSISNNKIIFIDNSPIKKFLRSTQLSHEEPFPSQESISSTSQNLDITNETINHNNKVVVIMDENDDDSDENSNISQNDKESLKSSKSNDRLEIDESNNHDEPKEVKKQRNKKAFPCEKCNQVFYHYKQIRKHLREIHEENLNDRSIEENENQAEDENSNTSHDHIRKSRRKPCLKVNLFNKKQLIQKNQINNDVETNNEKKSPPKKIDNSMYLDVTRIDEYPNIKVVEIELDENEDELMDGVKLRYLLFKDRLLVGK